MSFQAVHKSKLAASLVAFRKMFFSGVGFSLLSLLFFLVKVEHWPSGQG